MANWIRNDEDINIVKWTSEDERALVSSERLETRQKFNYVEEEFEYEMIVTDIVEKEKLRSEFNIPKGDVIGLAGVMTKTD